METKTCIDCGNTYPEDYFYRTTTGKRRWVCKDCHQKRRKLRRQLEKKGLKVCERCQELKTLQDFSPGARVCLSCKKEAKERAKVDAEIKKQAQQYDWEDEHQRVLKNTTLDKGIGDKPFTFQIKPDEAYKVSYRDSHTGVVLIGKVISQTDNFFVLQTKRGIRECFRYDDYKLGEYTIERVKA